MELDADLQALFDDENATLCNKLQCYSLQDARNERNRLAAATSEPMIALELRQQCYMTAFSNACDLRRQQMSTATTITTEDDILGDIDRISTKLYSTAIAKLSAL